MTTTLAKPEATPHFPPHNHSRRSTPQAKPTSHTIPNSIYCQLTSPALAKSTPPPTQTTFSPFPTTTMANYTPPHHSNLTKPPKCPASSQGEIPNYFGYSFHLVLFSIYYHSFLSSLSCFHTCCCVRAHMETSFARFQFF